MSAHITPELVAFLGAYRNDAAGNDDMWRRATAATDELPLLRRHRDWIETHNWGFGDRAFHYMWYMLLTGDVLRRPAPRLLEIGVFKGQVISLWALIARSCQAHPEITAISPLTGSISKGGGLWSRLRQIVDRRYAEDASSGNLYEHEDYLSAVRTVFREFDLDFGSVRLLRGFSSDAAVKAHVEREEFDLIYVDGGHRRDQVMHDIAYYGARVKVGGYLVLDDASYFLPGSVFWKGHESVSLAANDVNEAAFENVLNVGHNRVYRRNSQLPPLRESSAR